MIAMQKPFLSLALLGLTWALARSSRARKLHVSHHLDRRWPDALAGVRRRPRPRPRKRPEAGGVPVVPNRPNTLSGGAAAALEFD
jgi:hypothetical protein